MLVGRLTGDARPYRLETLPLLDGSTFVIALLWVWIRERTGSLLAPVISHSLGNGLKALV